ncbi:unnamed protein product, partial [Staurois parvus]
HRSNGKSRRCRLGHVVSCVQSQLIASCRADSSRGEESWKSAFLRGDIYTDHQGTDDQCALMICVAPAVPPVSAHQCQLSVLINATFRCLINATYQCLPVHINATYQCLPVHINATYQCPSELPFSVTYQ